MHRLLAMDTLIHCYVHYDFAVLLQNLYTGPLIIKKKIVYEKTIFSVFFFFLKNI